MARIKISVPDELKENMEAFGLNWSSIAKEAFEHAMHIARLKEENMDYKGGISHPRASKKANVELETFDTSPILARLDQIIAILSQPPIPPEKRLWTRSHVGEYLQLKDSALDRVLALPSFPDARRAGGGHPRYVAGEVMAWMEKQK